jgi:hypothetical protein
MKVLSVYRCVVISYVGRCCVWMEICLLNTTDPLYEQCVLFNIL